MVSERACLAAPLASGQIVFDLGVGKRVHAEGGHLDAHRGFATRPAQAAKRKRLEDKARRGALKKLRGKPPPSRD